jgi:hypothetical protein
MRLVAPSVRGGRSRSIRACDVTCTRAKSSPGKLLRTVTPNGARPRESANQVLIAFPQCPAVRKASTRRTLTAKPREHRPPRPKMASPPETVVESLPSGGVPVAAGVPAATGTPSRPSRRADAGASGLSGRRRGGDRRHRDQSGRGDQRTRAPSAGSADGGGRSAGGAANGLGGARLGRPDIEEGRALPAGHGRGSGWAEAVEERLQVRREGR